MSTYNDTNFNNSYLDGILGVGFNTNDYENILDRLYKNKITTNYSFSVDINGINEESNIIIDD